MTSYRADQRPTHQGRSGWEAILPPAPAGECLEADQTATFAVIGGGFAGLAAARRLTQLAPGEPIVLLEAGKIAEGAAGRNSGFMIDLPHELTSDDYSGAGSDSAIIAMNRKAQAFAADAVAEYGIDHNYFDRSGKVNGAASARAHAHNQSYAEHLSDLGEKAEWLDEKAMADLTGSRHYCSGLYTPGTVTLQPAGYIRGMASGLRRAGVTLYENTPVSAFHRSGDSWLINALKGKVKAKKIILCVNGHLESFGIKRGKLMQIFLFAMMTPELDTDALARLGGAARWGITPSDPMGTTLRRIDTAQGGNRIITRTCAALRSKRNAFNTDLTRARKVMQDKFDKRFPQLAGLQMEYVWAGHLCLSRNSVSVVREIDKGLFTGCVQNGLGTARGTLTGIAAAELACTRTGDIGAYFQQEADPLTLPPSPLRDWGGNAIIRWKEWRAREE